MNDNTLIAAIITTLQAGLTANGQGSVLIQQSNQPTQQGTPSAPTIFLHKIQDTRFGAPYRLNQWNDTVLASFTGSASLTTLSVTSVSSGMLEIGQILAGTNIPDNIQIIGLGAHTTGGTGTYVTSQSLGTIASQAMTTIEGMGYTETQQYLTTFQFSALATQDPTNTSSLTASDLANLAAGIMQSLSAITTFEALGVGILKISDVRNPPFTDDRERYEYSPNFDVTFTQKQIISSVQPVITETVLQVVEV